jgi:ATP-dependent helicase/nuclease subunit A
VVFAQGAPATKGLKQDDGKDRPHVAERKTQGQGLFEFWPPFLPADKQERDNWQAPVDRELENAPRQRLACHVADTLASWIGQRLLPSKGRPVEAGDILILLQKRGALFDALIAELRQRGIAVAGADRLKLQDSLAVKDLMALLQFCLLPEDDLSLACVLKSPLLAEPLNDDDLLAFAPKRSSNLWQALVASGKHLSAVAWLQDVMTLSSTAGPHGFLAAAITQSRRAMVARLGVEAQDATDVLLDVALSFERDQGTSLAAFLHWFMAREEDVKRDLEGPGNQVRLMTVHGAKGLEANIVILPDATDLPGPRGGPALLAVPGGGNGPAGVPLFNADTHVKPQVLQTWRNSGQEKSGDERKRLLYVAMTRARDELYIAGAQGERKLDEDCWYSLVKAALDATDKPLRRVVGQLPEGEALRWGEEPQFFAATAGKQQSTASQDALPGWATAPAPSDDAPSRWRGVTRLAAGSSAVFDKVAALRGLAIHRVLERLRRGDSREIMLQRLARQKLEAELAEPLLALVSDPETAPYFAPEAQSEAAIAGMPEGLPKVQGRVDRLLVTPEAIWVVDFKSGRKPGLIPPDYLRQMALYATVLADAFPGRPVRAALLWTQDATLVTLNHKELSQALDRLRQEEAAQAT